MRFGIVISEWHGDITENLLKGARQALSDCGARLDNIHIAYVPGSFELPLGAQLMFENSRVEAVICLGCVIRGETPHFDYVCQASAMGIGQVSLKFGKPAIYGVITAHNLQQARARSGGPQGNKGIEAAHTAVKMVAMQREISDTWNF